MFRYFCFSLSVFCCAAAIFHPEALLFAQENGGRQLSRAKWEEILARKPFESGIGFVPVNRIDMLFLDSLEWKKIRPADLCTDMVFVRRVYLDLYGAIPGEKEAKEFIDSTDPKKRAKLIEKLLESEEFVDYTSMQWCDVLRVKAEFPINLWPNGAMSYYRWIREAVRTNMPYDRFARELLSAEGSNFRDGNSNFYRAVPSKDPGTIAENVALTFLGERTENWSEEQRAELAVFFSRMAYKSTAEWKEEIVYRVRTPLESPDVVFPDGSRGTVPENVDPRNVFIDWLVSEKNVRFGECAVNRIWARLFGRGLVHEQDDFRTDNPPVHPEILEHLRKELVRSNYDCKHVYRLILNSSTYQQSSIPADRNPDALKFFAAYPIRRLKAEVLQDMFMKLFDVQNAYVSEVPEPFTYIPPKYRTILLHEPGISSSFLEMFGRSSRDTGMESDRNDEVSESQQLFMLNSTEINQWTRKLMWKYRNLGKRPTERVKNLETLWLEILSRYPSAEELQAVKLIFEEHENEPVQVMQDLIWSLLNSKEFVSAH